MICSTGWLDQSYGVKYVPLMSQSAIISGWLSIVKLANQILPGKSAGRLLSVASNEPSMSVTAS